MATSAINNRLEQCLAGAYIDLNSLIDARFAAKDLKLQQRRKALSLLAGPNKTNFRGRGIDFEEVRAYQPGDDIRTIDWRVTARSGKAYTKLFREERERPLLVVTDQRQAMFFGSQHCFKSVMACYLSALITWSGLQNNDRVGGLIFGNQTHKEVRPRRSRQSALRLMHLLLGFNERLNRDSGIGLSSANQLETALIELRRIARPGSAIYLISDFAGFSDSTVQKHLHQLSRHCEITALFIYDPLERQLPPPGQYTVTNGAQRQLIRTGGANTRQCYTEHFENTLKALHQSLKQWGIPLIEIGTDQAPLQRLLQYYGVRR
ncbi:MAG: DUF58 domain-containing protein [Spongiibacteraceae bacterium]|nr:DUF58 domain-containing protein [Spongiibacteraceae bacterium]